jgi:hypothetical protein
MRGDGERGVAEVSANEYSCAHGAQINFGDLTPFMVGGKAHSGGEGSELEWGDLRDIGHSSVGWGKVQN